MFTGTFMASISFLLPGPSGIPAVRLLLAAGLGLCLQFHGRAGTVPWPDEVPNFAMLDTDGRYHELHRAGSRAVVLFFTGNGCPVARQDIHKLKSLRQRFTESDLAIWVVDAVAEDDRPSMVKEARELGAQRTLAFMKDDTQGIAQLLGVTRTGTAVLISTKNGHVCYEGAVDDQLCEGAAKPQAMHEYLADALADFLAGHPTKDAATPSRGCLIHFEGKSKGTEISYAGEVAPILEKHCVSCHSPGNIGPFAMSDYQKVRSKSEMIRETLLGRRMPPWSADTAVGHFQDERTMTLEEKRVLLSWIAQGAVRGEGEDPLPSIKAPVPEKWPLGQPDAVVKIPVQDVAATGVLEYRHIQAEVPVTKDSWAGAVAIHPGNLKVLHHCIVRVKYRNSGDDGSERGVWLQGWAPGIRPERFPEGTGRRLPKGAVLDIELHYTTMGSAQKDETEIGFYKLAENPPLILENRGAYNQDFSISPGDAEVETLATLAVPKDSLLYSMSPHMHLRGSWMRYEALYPNGKREILLSVPHYDFNWQTSYRLAKPKKLPAGTWVLCTGGFDNSIRNPSNPDPGKRVTWGEQSFDEMFIGFMEMAEIPKVKSASSP